MVSEVVSNLEEQRKDLVESLNQENFINQLFPTYKKLQENLSLLLQTNTETASRMQSFDELQHEGAIIEGEYRIISKNYV